MQGQEGDAGGTGEINASADVVTKRWGCKGGLDAGGKERAVGRQSDASLKCIYCGRHEAEEEIVKPRMPKTLLTSEVNLRESRTGNKSNKASSEGSLVHPSMGIPLLSLTR